MAESTVEIAKKQRHILLLEKVKAGKALTPTEMRELDGYEAPAPPIPATSDKRQAPPYKLKGKRPTESEIRTAAFECSDLAAAAERLGLADLEALLGTSKRLSAAWDRGQLLRRVQDVASTTVVVPERADKLLSLAKGSFEHIYRTDRIVRELWDKARYEILVEIERALVVRVKEGDLKAVTAVEHLFGHRTDPVGLTDFTSLSPTEMETATGFPRQTVLRWAKENGLPRNADGTYSLPKFVAWLAKWERDKATGGREAAGLNPFQAKKTEQLEMALAEKRGRLLPRDEVMAGIVMRYQRLAQARQRAQDLAIQVLEQPAERVEQILGDFVDELCSRQVEDFGELRLPPAAEKLFGEILDELESHERSAEEHG